MGDVLLVQGRRSNIAALADDNAFRILGPVEEKRPNIRRARIAVAIFVAVLAAATSTSSTLPGSGLAGSGARVPDRLHHARGSLSGGRVEGIDS